MQGLAENIIGKFQRFVKECKGYADFASFYLGARYRRFRRLLQRHARSRFIAFGAGLMAIVFITFIGFVLSQTPSKKELTSIRNAVASEVYSKDSVLLGRYYIQDRTEIKFQDISRHLIDALIATEDVRFYQHHGIDYRSLGRVLVKTILLHPLCN